MIRTYKHDGKLWRYEEGEQPSGAVLVEVRSKEGAPVQRAAKAASKRRSSKGAEEKAE